jgi:hypothetical protein
MMVALGPDRSFLRSGNVLSISFGVFSDQRFNSVNVNVTVREFGLDTC